MSEKEKPAAAPGKRWEIDSVELRVARSAIPGITPFWSITVIRHPIKETACKGAKVKVYWYASKRMVERARCLQQALYNRWLQQIDEHVLKNLFPNPEEFER